jgi:hypothetical protein
VAEGLYGGFWQGFFPGGKVRMQIEIKIKE